MIVGFNALDKRKNNFLVKARLMHGDKYNYQKVEYKDSKTKIIITCLMHGDFIQNPPDHLSGNGCQQCSIDRRAKKRRLTLKDFLEKAKFKHGDKYNYNKVHYLNNNTNIIITCPDHGDFKQTPNNHFEGKGCNACGRLSTISKQRYDISEFIQKANIVHDHYYNYSKVQYDGAFTKVRIICPKHGEFMQSPGGHLNGKRCSKCANKAAALKITRTKKEFVTQANEVHGNLYDYSNVKYKNNLSKVTIICVKHGSFSQTPKDHLAGCGCPLCKESRGEKNVRLWLERNNIKFLVQWGDHDCILNFRVARFDFYLPDFEMLIEFDGVQHFEPVRFGGMSDKKAREHYERQKIVDELKDAWAAKNNFKMVRVSYKGLDKIGHILQRALLIK